MTTNANTPVQAATQPAVQISAVGVSGSGKGLREPIQVQVITAKADGTAQRISLPKPEGQPLVVEAKANNKFFVSIDGVRQTGNELVQGKKTSLKRSGKNLLIEAEGEVLVEITDFYAEATTMLDGSGWTYANTEGLTLAAGSAGVMPEATAVAAVQTGFGVTGLGAGGLGLALGGGGGGGTAAAAVPEAAKLFKLTVTAVAGPFKTNVLMILTTEDGTRYSAVSDPNGKHVFDIPAGYKGTLLVTVKDLNGTGDTDFMDEATGSDKSLNTQLRAMLATDNTKDLSITVSPVTELAARQAGLGDGDTAKAPAAGTIAAANAAVATLLGMDGVDIVFTQPTLIINADGTANSAYDDTNGVTDAEKYARVLAMLSGLDVKNGGSVDTTLDNLQAMVKADNQGAITDQLIEGAKEFEYVVETTSNKNTAGFANLLDGTTGAPTFAPRTMNEPTAATNTLAGTEANSVAGADGGELALGADGKRHINAAEAGPLAFTAALPDGAIAGDVVTLTINGIEVTRALTAADIASGTATVTATAAQAAAILVAANAAGGTGGVPTVTAATVGAIGSTTPDAIPLSAVAASSAPAIFVPTPLPSAAVAGDVVTLTIKNADGTTTLVPYTLTQADILAGVAQVPVSKAQLGADGDKTITAAVKSADGSITSPTFPVLDFSLDTTAPLINPANSPASALAPVTTATVPGNDVGSRDAPNFTSDKTPTITGGPVEAGATVEVTLNGKTYSSTGTNPAITIAADGKWTLTVPDSDALAGSGGLGVSYVPVVKVIDAAGNSSTANGTPFAVYVDVGGGLAPSSDTAGPAGSGGTTADNITNDTTPTISGKVPVGTAEVSVTIGNVTYSTAPDTPADQKITLDTATGAWSFTAQTLPANGVYTPLITLKDQVGNSATVSGTPFTLDTAGPAITSGGLASASNTGETTDQITKDDRPTFTGTGEPGAAVSLVVGGVTLTGTVGLDGTWSLSWPVAPAAALADTSTDGQGTKYTPQITLTDAAGNATTKAGTEFTLDTTGPSAASPAFTGGLDALSDGAPGTAADNLTNDDTPVLSGKAEKGAKVEVIIGTGADAKTYTTTADENGNWSVAVTTALVGDPATEYKPTVKLTDAAGTTTTIANAFTFTVDTVAVAATDITGKLQAVAPNDTGTLSDNLTSNRLPTLTGTTEAGSRVEVTVAGKTYTATVAADGTWSVPVGSLSNVANGTAAGLSNGFYTPQIKVTDAAGNTTTKDGTDFQIDFTAPSLQGITGGLTSDVDTNNLTANDSGTKGDNLTRDTTPTLSGTGEPGSTVVVTLKSSVAGAPDIVLTGVTVGPDGTWSATVTAALADATYTPSVVATDVAGNASAPKAITPFTIDATAPVAPVGKLAFVSDTGVAETKITKLQNPNLQGDAEPNSVVELKITVDGTERTYTTTANSLGKWTVELTGALLPNGKYTYTLSSTDKAGNVATATMTDNFTVDTNSASGNASLATASDSAGPTGTTADRVTKTTKPVIEGQVQNFQPTDLVEVTIGGLKYSNAVGTDPLLAFTVATDGKWSFTVRDDLTEGDYVPLVLATTGGNTTPLNGTGFTVDLTAPDLGVTAALSRTAANDTGLVGDNLTKVTKPLFNGTAESGASITLEVKNEAGDAVIATVGPITVGANGQWTSTGAAWLFNDTALTALPSAKYTLNAVVTDKAGNVTTTALPGTDFTVDATIPSAGGFTGALAEASNSGSTTDSITSATRPTLTGQAEAGAKVEVTVDGKTYTTYAGENGTWSVAVTTPLAGSPATQYSPTVKLTDAAGNVTDIAASDNFKFTVDTERPLAAAGGLASGTGNQTGTDTDGTPLTKVNTPNLSGTAPENSVVEVTIGGVTYTNASPTPAGMTGGLVLTGTAWTLPLTTALTDGVQVPQIKVTDPAGNSTTANGTAFRVDTAGPAAQSITGALTVDVDADTPANTANDNDSGTKGDNLTLDTTPELNGTSEPGSTVTVVLKSSVSGAADVTLTVETQLDGTWNAVVPSGTALANATYTPVITVTDKAGNATPKNGTPFTVDAAVPDKQSDGTAITGGLAAASDTGVADGKTSDTTPTLTGFAEKGAKVVISVGGKTYETTANPITGAWSITADELGTTTATYTPTITVTDKAGNVAGPTNLTAFTVDTTAPLVNGALTVDTVTDNADANDSGLTGDNITRKNKPQVSGTAENGAAIEVTIDSVIYKTTASATNGTWSITIGNGGKDAIGGDVTGHTLANGTYIPRIKVTNSVGNASTADGTPFVVDFAPPPAEGITGALKIDLGNTAITANDSGVKGDNTTRDDTPTFSGTAETGSSVVLTVRSATATAADPGTAIQTLAPFTVTSATGAWEATAAALPGTGISGISYTLWATVTDAAGNVTTQQLTGFTIDATNPVAPSGGLKSDAANDTGNLSNDNRTNNTQPVLTGSAEPGATVAVTVGNATYTTLADASGVWTVFVTSAAGLTDTSTDRKGTTITPVIVATDKAGNSSAATNGTPFVLDTQAPNSTNYTSTLPGGPSTTPALTGTVEAGIYKVAVTLNGKTYDNISTPSALTYNSSSGVWNLAVPATDALPSGTYTPQIVVTDLAGNSNAPKAGGPITVTVNLDGRLDASSETKGTLVGSLNDNLTSDSTPKLSGSCPTNSKLEITLTNGSTVKNYTIANTGMASTWSFDVPDTLAPGNWSVALKATNLGNATLVTLASGTPFDIDIAAPSVSSQDLTGGLASSVDSGSKGDGVTSGVVSGVSQTNVILTGSVEPGAQVSVILVDRAASATVGSTYTAVANNQGIWTLTGPAFASLTSGKVYDIKVIAGDAAGNPTAQTTVGNFTYDTAAPKFTSVTLSGLDANGTTAQSNLLTAGDFLIVTAQTPANEEIILRGTGKPTYTLTIDRGLVSGTVTEPTEITAVYDVDLSNLATGKMVFVYNVKTGDRDTLGGLTAVAAKFNLPSTATLTDVAGNSFDTTSAGVPALGTNSITIDAVAPTLVPTTGIAITSNPGLDKTYKADDLITFSVTFNEAVKFSDANVGLHFKIGNVTVTAKADADFATLSNTKTFSYKVLDGDNDTGGISIAANPVVIEGATTTITDAAGNAAVLSYAATTPDNTSHMVDTAPPTVQIYAAAIPSSTTEVRGPQTITFSFNEDPGSTFVWDPATPSATANSLTVSGGTLGALSSISKVGNAWVATATFTPAATTEGPASIAVANDKFKDIAGNFNKDVLDADNTLSFLVDTIAPVLQSIDVSDSVLIKTTSGALETATLTFKFSEVPVGFTLADIIVYENDGTTVAALGDYGAFGPLVLTDKEAVVVFTPLDGKARTIKFGVNANVFKDEAGNDNTAPLVSAGVEVATTAPSVQAVTITTTDSTGTANTGDTLVATDKVLIKVEYTTSVKLTGTPPKFEFFVGALKREALLVTDENISEALKSGGGKFMVFEYTVPANTDLGTFNDGLISANAGALKIAVGTSVVAANNPSITASNGTPVSVLGDFATQAVVVDNVLPTVAISVDSGVSVLDAASPNPTVRFVFSEAPTGFTKDAVTITGGGTLSAVVLDPTSEGKTYTATYTPPTGAAAIDRTTVVLSIANDKILDAAGNKNADGTNADNKVTFTVDNKIAVVSSLLITSTGQSNFYNTGDTITFVASFPENVFVTGFGESAPFVEFKMGTDTTLRKAFYTAGSGTGALTFSYVVQPLDTDVDGISVAANAIKLNSQTIKDQIGNNANLNNALLADASGAHKVDTTAPTVTLSVTGGVTALKKDETAEIVFTFSEDPVGFDGLAASDVTITGGGTLGPIGSKITNGNGTFSYKATYTPPTNAAAGTLVSITVPVSKVTDTAGNSNPAGNTVNFTVDTAPPVALGLTLTNDSADVANVAGTTSDTITNNTALTVANAETGATVQYKIVKVVGGVEQTSVTMDWGTLTQYTAAMANATTTPDGDYKVYARQTDLAGNIGAETGSITFTKDTEAKNNLGMALTADTLAAAAKVPSGDFGTNSDKITNDARFAAKDAESGAVIQYKTGSTWSSTYTAPTTDGEKTVFVRQIDKAGNISAEQSFTFTLDTKAPTEASFGGGLVSSDDTGLLSSDRITNLSGGTNATTLSLAGQSEAGTYIKVVVKQGTTTVGTYEASSNATTGEWTLDIPKTALVAATGQVVFTYDIVSTDLAGNSTTRAASTYTTQSFTVDYTGPADTTGKLSALSDSGSSDTDARTNEKNPVLSGKAEANARISVLIAGKTYNTTADGNGDWSVKVETALEDTTPAGTTATVAGGTLFEGWTITATDAAGNESTVIATTANGMAFTLDRKATDTSLITGALVKESLYDTGTSFIDGKTRNTRPNVEGTAEANAKVAVTLGGVVYNTTASSTGQWLISVTNPLAEGQHTPSIVVTDTAGNTVTKLGTQFTVDITAPLIPYITSSPMTNTRKPIIKGTGEAGETIFVDVPGTAGTATKGSFKVLVDNDGTWTLDLSSPDTLELNSNTKNVFQTAANAAIVVEAYSFDVAGNLSAKSSQSLRVDTQPPAAPIITSENTTSDTMPAISGTGEIGATVTLTTTVNGVQVTTTAVVGQDGKWFINLETAVLKNSSGTTVGFTELTHGAVLPLSVTQTDQAGNTAASPTTGSLTIDTTLPVLTTVFDKSEPVPVANPGLTTNDVTPIIKGTASPLQMVNITITGRNNDAITFQNIAVNAQGFWELNTYNDKAGVNKTQYKDASGAWVNIDPTSGVWSAVQQQGGYAYSVQVTQGTKSTNSVIILDEIIPAVSFGSNPISQDDIINKAELDAGPVLSGTAEPGAKVDLLFAGVVRTATVKTDGTWSYELTPADVVLLGQSAKGLTGPVLDKPITVRATDPAGNTNTATRSIAIDTVLPVLDLNRADGLSQNWAVPLVGNSEYGFDNGADVNTTAASLTDVQSVNKITLFIDKNNLKNGGDEVLLLGDVAFAANGNGAPASLLFAGVTWNVLYANNMFTFTATSVPATTAPVQAFFRNLRYQNKAAVIDVSGDRVFEIQVFDTAGNGSAKVTSTMTNDKIGPVIDLDGGNATSLNRTTTVAPAAAAAGLALVATSSLTDQNRIARVQVKVAGLRDGTAEKLVVGTTELNANGSGLAVSQTVSDGATPTPNTWAVTYLASTGEFLFNLPGGTATTAQANALLASLKYKNTATTATDGARTFDITAVDSVNNVTGGGAGSSVVQSSVVINGPKPTFAPEVAQVFTAATATAVAKSSTGRVTTYDTNADGVLGDQFELAFSELVATSDLVKQASGINSNWSISTGSLANATITAVNPVTLINADGTTTQYARSFLFAGVTGHTTLTTITALASKVVGTAGAAADTAAGNVEFTMTDIVAANAPKPPLNLAADNLVSFNEAWGVNSLRFDHTAAQSGDIMKVYRDGLWIKDVTMTANAAFTTVSLIGAANPPQQGTRYIMLRRDGSTTGFDVAEVAVIVNGTNVALNKAVLVGPQGTLAGSSAGALVNGSTGDTGANSYYGGLNSANSWVQIDLGDWYSNISGGIFLTPRASVPSRLANTFVYASATDMSSQLGDTTPAQAPAGGFLAYTTPASVTASAALFSPAVPYSATNALQGSALPNDWSIDGSHSYTVRIQDTAGNLGAASAPKAVQVDTAITGGISSLVATDSGAAGPTQGDVLRIVFNESLNLPLTTAAGLPADLFGAGATAVGVGLVNNRSTTWQVTLGTNPDAALAGKSFTITGVTDVPGNTGSITATVPADAFDKPGEITIANVTSDNVINSTERGAAQDVTLNLVSAKTGDVVKLFMGGVEIGSTNLTSNATTAVISVAANGWGADGERTLSATITRPSDDGKLDTTVTSANRSVYVNADAAHWSAVNTGTLWFDPDTLVQASGTQVTQWNASAGTTAAGGALSVGSTGAAGSVIATRDASGHMQLYFDGASTLNSTALVGMPTVSGGFSDFSVFKRIGLVSDYAYTFTRFIAGSTNVARNHYGTGPGNGVTEHFAADSGTAGQMTPANTTTINNWMVLNGFSTGANGILGVSVDNNNVATKALNGTLNGGLGGFGSASRSASESIIFGGSSGNSQRIQAILADQIAFQQTITQAQRDEAAVYLAQKYQGVGTQVPVTASGQTYNLSASAGTGALLDDVLQLGDKAQGAGNDTITVAGRDYVNAGSGNDIVKAKDLHFRSLDGGQGFDTFELHNEYTADTFILTDYVSNARGVGADTAANTRVNGNGFHKLLGFERLDFSQSTAKQVVTVAAADVDQLAEKNLAQGTNVIVNATTSNLFVALGANDHLAAPTANGFGAVKYGFWLDAAGMAYERQYTASLGGTSNETANLFVRGGDDAPDLGFTASSGSYSANGVSLDFSETMNVASLTASEFTINGNAATSATMTAGGLNLGYTPGGLTGLVRVIYTGTAIQDQETDQLRYKDITLGTSFADTISAAGLDTNQAILGGAGGDTITGGNKDDLLMGMSGNDNLTGGTGADTFRFIQFETGTDTITDFTKTQGDKVDLRGILKDSGFDADKLTNLSSFLNITQSGTDVVLKVDDQGIGNFALPTQTIIMSGAANGTTNLYVDTALATLNQLIDQRVILV